MEAVLAVFFRLVHLFDNFVGFITPLVWGFLVVRLLWGVHNARSMEFFDGSVVMRRL